MNEPVSKDNTTKTEVIILGLSVIGLALLASILGFSKTEATKKPVEKSILCDDLKPQLVRVEASRLTLLNFPLRPKEVIPGSGGFDFQQIKNDLAIKSLRPGARTNVAVYLTERRCSFELVTVSTGGDKILIVRDPKDQQFEVKFYDK